MRSTSTRRRTGSVGILTPLTMFSATRALLSTQASSSSTRPPTVRPSRSSRSAQLTPPTANFLSLLTHLQVPTIETKMSFSVSSPTLEYSGSTFRTLLAHPSNLWNPSFLLLLADILRFNTFAPDLLAEAPDDTLSLGTYLEREHYSDPFKTLYILPLTSAVWSTPAADCALDFPAHTLIRFLYNHRLLNTLSPHPTWRTIRGGSREYIRALTRGLQRWQIHLGTRVKRVGTRKRDNRPYLVVEDTSESGTESGSSEGEYAYVYDHIIVATHGDEALDLLGSRATAKEERVLRAFTTRENHVVLHSDARLLPRARAAWAAWNYKAPDGALTYNMNILQHVSRRAFGNVLVTLNPSRVLKGVQREWKVRYPVYTAAAVGAQRALVQIQERRGIQWVGAWTGYGFHEDGCRSGLEAAGRLGAGVPWGEVVGAERGVGGRRGWWWLLRRVLVWVLCVWVVRVLGWGVDEVRRRRRRKME